MSQHFLLIPMASCCALLVALSVTPAAARQTTVSGTAGVSYDHQERSYDDQLLDASDDGDRRKIGVEPGVLIVSRGLYDTFSFRYAPLINHDFVTENTEVDHRLSLVADRSLSRNWSLSLSNDFVLSDDPGRSTVSAIAPDPVGPDEQAPPVGEQPLGPESDITDGLPSQQAPPAGDDLSRDLSGQRYWTNTASIRTSGALAEQTRLGGGYSYTVLRNQGDSSGYNEYDKHAFTADFSQGFGPSWRTDLVLGYVLGLYTDEDADTAASPDVQEYNARIGLEHVRSIRDSFPLSYSFSGTAYDGDTRRDSQTHAWSAGWNHAFDPQTRMAIAGGPSYAKVDGLEGEWGYNAFLALNKSYQYTTYGLVFSKDYQTRNFTGTDESGLTDTYSLQATCTHQYSQALALNLYGRYTWQSSLDPQGAFRIAAIEDEGGLAAEDGIGDLTYDKNTYEIGAGLSYSFGRWYTAGVRYSYYVSDGELPSDQYNDHQVLVTLSASREFWRW
ncbi:hypothetical protein [Desulfobulbus alkaliphilus]|uniref:hypothetical protein n=1 Tax=Desulfobulbus alkaliphilus TaxID=869814 RepID=UPI00196411E1|nr:hypothetical protein [Desulfobulbus alkaliphilus]MBM9538161.1 hypothetical protein [Desulfobulbus alkaliphilus]